MQIEHTAIPGLLIVQPRVFRDGRGAFCESYQRERYREAGIDVEFVQDNYSRSVRATLRGLHYQIERPQGKLVWVARGEVFDVAVDLRRRSPTFGKWVGTALSDSDYRQLYIPPGLAHGFCVLSESADFAYKCTDYYSPGHERTLLWNDSSLGIRWPVAEPLLSEKDRRGAPFSEADYFEDL